MQDDDGRAVAADGVAEHLGPNVAVDPRRGRSDLDVLLLDLPPGTIRLKRDGGHGGHNGLRDLIPALGGKDFLRLRIGIGHPGHRDDVVGYVLKAASRDERASIDMAIAAAVGVLPDIISGNLDAAIESQLKEIERGLTDLARRSAG